MALQKFKWGTPVATTITHKNPLSVKEYGNGYKSVFLETTQGTLIEAMVNFKHKTEVIGEAIDFIRYHVQNGLPFMIDIYSNKRLYSIIGVVTGDITEVQTDTAQGTLTFKIEEIPGVNDYV